MLPPPRDTRAPQAPPRRARGGGRSGPSFQALEPRALLSAALEPDGTLHILGGPGHDAIVIHTGQTRGRVALHGVPGLPDGTVFDSVASIRALLRAGDDSLLLTGPLRAAPSGPIRLVAEGGAGRDSISGGRGDDHIAGGPGADVLDGGGGDDVLSGGDGADQIFGRAGRDSIEGEDGPDLLLGGPGQDTLRGRRGDDRLRAGSQDDTASGGAGDDDVYAGAGADAISGGAGADILRGLLAEFRDLEPEDVNGYDTQSTTTFRAAPTPEFWIAFDAIIGEGDIPPPLRDATTALQILKARTAHEREDFDQEFNQLGHFRDPARDDARDRARPHLEAARADPSIISQAWSADAWDSISHALDWPVPEFPRDDLDRYIDSLHAQAPSLLALGAALDQIESADLWFDQFADLYAFWW